MRRMGLMGLMALVASVAMAVDVRYSDQIAPRSYSARIWTQGVSFPADSNRPSMGQIRRWHDSMPSGGGGWDSATANAGIGLLMSWSGDTGTVYVDTTWLDSVITVKSQKAAIDQQARDTATAALRFAERDSVHNDRDSIRLDGKLDTNGKAADATKADSSTGGATRATLSDSTVKIPDAITGTSVTITGRDSAAAQKGDSGLFKQLTVANTSAIANTGNTVSITNTPAVGTVTQYGTGLSDFTWHTSSYAGHKTADTFFVAVQYAGATDTFKWKQGRTGTYAKWILSAGTKKAMAVGCSLTVAAATGHTINDSWLVPVAAPMPISIRHPNGSGFFDIFPDGAVQAGYGNTASGLNATVAGGTGNTASGIGATISGGLRGIASGPASAIMGGTDNQASNIGAISCASAGKATGVYSLALGGYNPFATNVYSVAIGGELNKSAGLASVSMGGMYSTIAAPYGVGVGSYDTVPAADSGAQVYGHSLTSRGKWTINIGFRPGGTFHIYNRDSVVTPGGVDMKVHGPMTVDSLATFTLRDTGTVAIRDTFKGYLNGAAATAEDSKLLQGKDTTALFAAKTATEMSTDGDSNEVWGMSNPTTQGWIDQSGGTGTDTATVESIAGARARDSTLRALTDSLQNIRCNKITPDTIDGALVFEDTLDADISGGAGNVGGADLDSLLALIAAGGGGFDTTDDYGVDGTWRFKDTVRFTGSTEFTYVEGDTYWTVSDNGDSTGFCFSGGVLRLLAPNVTIEDLRLHQEAITMPYYSTDFAGLSNGQVGQYLAAPWYLNLSNMVDSSAPTYTSALYANHPGVLVATSTSTGNAFSAVLNHNAGVSYLSGGEVTDGIFMLPVLDSIYFYGGWHQADGDAQKTPPPTGALFCVRPEGATDGVLRLMSVIGGSDSTKAASAETLSAATWYRYHLEVNAASTYIIGSFYTCDDQTLIFQDSVVTKAWDDDGDGVSANMVTCDMSPVDRAFAAYDFVGFGFGQPLTR